MDDWIEIDFLAEAGGWVAGAIGEVADAFSRKRPRRFGWKTRNAWRLDKDREEEEAKVRAAKRTRRSG